MPFIRNAQSKWSNRRTDASRSITRLTALGLAVLLVAASASAQKPPTLIRQHLLEDPEMEVATVKSVKPHRAEPLNAVLSTGVWQVAYEKADRDGESLIFMAVDDGEVVRIRRFDEPATRENFVGLLRDDFRVKSVDDARRLVSATLELYFGFPFSEPEMTADEMRAEQRGNAYFLVDGERFGDPTGYRIATDADGRVIEYEYRWELSLGD